MTEKGGVSNFKEVFPVSVNGKAASREIFAPTGLTVWERLGKLSAKICRKNFEAWLVKAWEKWIAVVIFLLIWDLAPRLGLISRTYIPPFSEVVVKGFEFFLSGKLTPHIIASVCRSAGGFAFALAIGVPLGLFVGWFGRLERYLDSLLHLLRQVNAFALFPLFILFFGLGYMTQVAIIFWVVFWPILLNTINGVKQVDPLLVKSARSMGISQGAFFTKVIMPSAVPSIITGMRLGATYSLLMLVGAEMVGADSGLGYLIMNAQYLLSVHLAYVGVIIVILLGLLVNFALVCFEKRLTSWKESVPV